MDAERAAVRRADGGAGMATGRVAGRGGRERRDATGLRAGRVGVGDLRAWEGRLAGPGVNGRGGAGSRARADAVWWILLVRSWHVNRREPSSARGGRPDRRRRARAKPSDPDTTVDGRDGG